MDKPKVASRGIPSKEAFYLPAYYSPEIRKFEDDNENPMRNYWNLKEIINFVFPEKYQQTYHSIALKFMEMLVNKLKVEGHDINQFINQEKISKATFYNRVLPRLKRLGLIKVERLTIDSSKSKQKYRPMIITLSKTFGNYLNKIGESWLAIVDDARSRK